MKDGEESLVRTEIEGRMIMWGKPNEENTFALRTEDEIKLLNYFLENYWKSNVRITIERIDEFSEEIEP